MSAKIAMKAVVGAFLFSFTPSVLDASCSTVQNTIRISTTTCCDSNNNCYACGGAPRGFPLGRCA